MGKRRRNPPKIVPGQLGSWPYEIPFERAVRLNLARLQEMHDCGMTWKSIAGVLTKLGARHQDGRVIAGQQLNTVALRVEKEDRMKDSSAAHHISKLSDEKAISISSNPEPPTVKTREKSLKAPTGSRNSLMRRLDEAHLMRKASDSAFEE